MTTTRPMAITMGDASGVGPEIVLRRAADGAFAAEPVVVYGDAGILRHGAELLGVDVDIEVIDGPMHWHSGALQVVDAGLLALADHRPGFSAATAMESTIAGTAIQ